jgi:YD repeat-containing protein
VTAYRDIDGNITQHTYDNYGRQATLTDPHNKVTSYTYATPADLAFPVGSIKQIIHGNGSKAVYTYDSLGRTDRIADNVLLHGVGAFNEGGFLQYESSPDNVLKGAFAPGEGGLHPTQKPLALMQELIELTTSKG